MRTNCFEEEVIVHPVDGMQLSSGYIHRDKTRRYVGSLPGMAVSVGNTLDEVLNGMERNARAYYGDDVVVELVRHAVTY